MKIIFFGTPEFAVPALENLNSSPNIEILAVITQPDKSVGRKQILTAPPVKKSAEKLGIKVLQPKNKKELEADLSDIKADFYVVIAYGMILTKKILELPKYGAINIHASLLPQYRGASPIQASLLHGDHETGVSIIKMDEEMDHGPIYLLKKLQIAETDSLQSLTAKLADSGAAIIPHVLQDIIDGNLTPIEQNHQKATYCKKISKEDGKINWNLSAREIVNIIRAYTPWPSAYTSFNNKKLKIVKAEAETIESRKNPGTFFVEGKMLKIATGKGNLIPKELQPEGKNSMTAENFLNGYRKIIHP